MSDNTSVEYAQGLSNIQHARLTPVVDRCKATERLESIIHFKCGGQVKVSGLFASEINRRLRAEAAKQ